MTDKVKSEKKAMILELLPRKNYHVGKVCGAVNVPRRTFYNWREDDIDFDEACDEVFQYDVDDSEEKMKLLRQGIPDFDKENRFIGWKERPHFGALVKHLESKGKDRGWGASIEIKDERQEEIRSLTDKELALAVVEVVDSTNDVTWDITQDGESQVD